VPARETGPDPVSYDVLVIGSGFGGSVAALRATEKGYRVGVLEAGRRFGPEDFAKTNWRLRRHLWLPHVGFRGILRLNLLRHVLVLSGAGVGGGSLLYANVLYEPADAEPSLKPHYELAKKMLGATTVPFETPADRVIRALADEWGVRDTYRPAEVGVYFGEDSADPFFGGEGPARKGCIRCGGCIVGCRYNAKNTLDLNYLYLAERGGAVVHPDHAAVDVRPLPEGGYEVVTQRPGALIRKQRRTFRAEQVVLAAGVLGTTKLLFRLPNASSRVGELVRTNSEALVAAGARSTDVDYSQGVTVTSSFDPEPGTQIQPFRYPRGSNLIGLLATVLVDRSGSRTLGFLEVVVRHPLRFLRKLSVRRWSERTILLLVMQTGDNSLRLVSRRGRLRSQPGAGEQPPRYLPIANDAARAAARVMGGRAGNSTVDLLLGIPMTAHVLGGACVGDSREDGVIDSFHRVFGYPGLHVVDGSAVGRNLGVNPALTIAAQAERAMASWPRAGEPDSRPPQA